MAAMCVPVAALAGKLAAGIVSQLGAAGASLRLCEAVAAAVCMVLYNKVGAAELDDALLPGILGLHQLVDLVVQVADPELTEASCRAQSMSVDACISHT